VARRALTEAQCFRMNVDVTSWLNLLGIRQGPTKA
jgi:hypothetical protein